jgi:hypothetical protein
MTNIKIYEKFKYFIKFFLGVIKLKKRISLIIKYIKIYQIIIFCLMINYNSEKTVSNISRIICGLFRSILYKKSAQDFPLKTKLTFIPLSNRPEMKNKNSI